MEKCGGVQFPHIFSLMAIALTELVMGVQAVVRGPVPVSCISLSSFGVRNRNMSFFDVLSTPGSIFVIGQHELNTTLPMMDLPPYPFSKLDRASIGSAGEGDDVDLFPFLLDPLQVRAVTDRPRCLSDDYWGVVMLLFSLIHSSLPSPVVPWVHDPSSRNTVNRCIVGHLSRCYSAFTKTSASLTKVLKGIVSLEAGGDDDPCFLDFFGFERLHSPSKCNVRLMESILKLVISCELGLSSEADLGAKLRFDARSAYDGFPDDFRKPQDQPRALSETDYLRLWNHRSDGKSDKLERLSTCAYLGSNIVELLVAEVMLGYPEDGVVFIPWDTWNALINGNNTDATAEKCELWTSYGLDVKIQQLRDMYVFIIQCVSLPLLYLS